MKIEQVQRLRQNGCVVRNESELASQIISNLVGEDPSIKDKLQKWAGEIISEEKKRLETKLKDLKEDCVKIQGQNEIY